MRDFSFSSLFILDVAINLKRTTSSLATPVFYVYNEKLAVKRKKVPHSDIICIRFL